MAFRGGGEYLYTINIDGTGVKKLTPDNSLIEAWPTWSPDGGQIGFGAAKGSGVTYYAFHKINSDGTNLTRITNPSSAIWNPSWGRGRVQSPTDAPAAYDQTKQFYEDVPTAITLTGFDPKGGSLSHTLLSHPTEGTLLGTAPNLIYTPDTNYNGYDSFLFKVSNGSKDSAVAKVTLFVEFVDDPPTVSSISNQVIDEDNETNELSFIVGNDTLSQSNAFSSLTVTASSSNSTLFPPSSIILGGSDANRTIKLTPAPNEFGTAQITIEVGERQTFSNQIIFSTQTTFQVTVNSVEDAPTVSPLDNQSLIEGQTTSNLPFTVYDPETSAENLVVTATSNNGTLIPLMVLGAL